MKSPHQRIWSHWNVTPWRDSRICYSHNVWPSPWMFAALTAWCERMCCSLSCLRGRHLSTSSTCSERPPLCFRYGRHVHLAALFMPALLWLNVGKYSLLNVCPARFPWQHMLRKKVRTPLRNPQKAKKWTMWGFIPVIFCCGYLVWSGWKKNGNICLLLAPNSLLKRVVVNVNDDVVKHL